MSAVVGIPLRYQKFEDNRAILYISERLRRTIQRAGGFVFPIVPVQDVDYFHTSGCDFKELSVDEKMIIDEYLEYCDGIIFPGGIKFTPYDRYLLEQAIFRKMPVLGICLGMQMMSCYGEDIELNLIDEDNSHYQDDDFCLTHKVILNKNCKLYKIFGQEEIMVNSFHKKCVSENEFYRTIGKSIDGVIEAIEYPSDVFNIGIQWHPEISYEFDDNSRKLIDAFIEECQNSKLRKISIK